jgi:aminodeoxyfutalosine synthase
VPTIFKWADGGYGPPTKTKASSFAARDCYQGEIMPTDASRLQAIREKVEAGQRLSFEDGLALEASNDLFTLGELANLVRERYNGHFAYYNVNMHINPTNVCVYRCDFCAFRADLDEDRAYVMGRDQIHERARQAHERGATELHIVGGLHHKLPFDYYVDVVRWVKQAAPEIHVKAYTGVEIEFFAKIARLSFREVLERLIAAGLGSLPGGGAEIFHPEVRDQICGAKASTETWLEIHRTAHQLGLHSNATMLYGHVEGPKHRIDHLVRLRALQDETGGFQTFIPLAFHPDNSRMSDIPKPSGLMDLKTMAISRLMLDNFPHIKAYWVMLGIKTAQVALAFGADDLDGTVVHEKIYHEAGAETPQELSVAEIERLIREAGRVPVERDTLYRRVDREGSRWQSREPIDVPALAVLGG